jgi:hypothetical protein
MKVIIIFAACEDKNAAGKKPSALIVSALVRVFQKLGVFCQALLNSCRYSYPPALRYDSEMQKHLPARIHLPTFRRSPFRKFHFCCLFVNLLYILSQICNH